MLQEFKSFAVRGNVVDLAVGVIIGAAFGKIVSSLVEDVIMPPIGYILGGIDFSGLMIALGSGGAAIKYGVFINVVINFLIVSFVIFIIIKQMNRFKKQEDAKPAEPSEEVKLLREIRDSVKK